MVVLVLRGDHNVGVGANRRLCEVEIFCNHLLRMREVRALSTGIVDNNTKAEQVGEHSQGLGDPAMTCDKEIGLGHDRLDVDLYFPTTGHSYAQEFVSHVERDDERLL